MNLLAKKHVVTSNNSRISLEEIQNVSGMDKKEIEVIIQDQDPLIDDTDQLIEENEDTHDQEPEVDRQDLGDIQKVFKHIDLKELQVRQMNARIANSYFPDKQAIKIAKFDIKTALLDGAKKQ